MKILRIPPVRRAHLRAFTLIELLVVIAIIALLAALSMGAFTYAMQSAARNKTTGFLQTIMAALAQYKDKFGEYPEPANPAAMPSGAAGGSSTYPIGGALTLYQAITGDGYDQIVLATQPANGAPSTSDGIVDNVEQGNSINGSLPQPMIYPPASVLKPGTPGQRWLIDGFGNPFQYTKATTSAGGTTVANPNAVNADYDLWSFGQLQNQPASPSKATKLDSLKTAPWIKNW
jgi:prepilin-type N-terminal cleavage/methylation domain-containing protein